MPTAVPEVVDVGAYIRVSRVMDRGGETFLSPDIQLGAVRAWADREFGPGRWQLIEIFRDMDESGTSMDRTELRRAFDFAADGKIRVLALYDLSRWARCVADGIRDLEALANIGCRVASTSEQIDLDTPEGELSITFMLAVHQFKARQAAKQWQQTIAAQGERGRHHGRAPFGYMRAGEKELPNGRIAATGNLVPDPMRVEVAREIFERFADGESAVSIEDDLMRRGYPQMRVRRMVSNPTYIGKVVRREHVGKAIRKPGQKTARRRLVAGPGSSKRFDAVRVFDGQHEAIISQEVWDKCQRRLDQDAATPKRSLEVLYPLMRLVVCDYCDMMLVRQTQRRDGKVYLRDSNGMRTRGCCGVGAVDSDLLLRYVRDELVRLADKFTYDLADELNKTQTKRQEIQARTDALRAEHERLTERLVNLAINRGAVVGGDAVYEKAAAKVNGQREDIEAQVADLEAQMPDEPTVNVARALHQLAELWDELTEEGLNRIARQWIKQIRVRKAEKKRKYQTLDYLDGRVDIVPRFAAGAPLPRQALLE